MIKEEYQRSRKALLDLLQTEELLRDNRSLARSLALRIPYLNALNGLQVAMLKRLRKRARQSARPADGSLDHQRRGARFA